jgi:hypothetical protein
MGGIKKKPLIFYAAKRAAKGIHFTARGRQRLK